MQLCPRTYARLYTTNSILKWNGTKWEIGIDNTSGSDGTMVGQTLTLTGGDQALDITGNATISGTIQIGRLIESPMGTTGYSSVYAKTDGNLYFRDETGSELSLTSKYSNTGLYGSCRRSSGSQCNICQASPPATCATDKSCACPTEFEIVQTDYAGTGSACTTHHFACYKRDPAATYVWEMIGTQNITMVFGTCTGTNQYTVTCDTGNFNRALYVYNAAKQNVSTSQGSSAALSSNNISITIEGQDSCTNETNTVVSAAIYKCTLR